MLLPKGFIPATRELSEPNLSKRGCVDVMYLTDCKYMQVLLIHTTIPLGKKDKF